MTIPSWLRERVGVRGRVGERESEGERGRDIERRERERGERGEERERQQVSSPHTLFERGGGGLVFKAHRLWYHSTLCSRVMKRNKKKAGLG
jgi:hypothetical protein